jgi:hypothetical protein
MRLNEDGKTVASFDVLAPEVHFIIYLDWRNYRWIAKRRTLGVVGTALGRHETGSEELLVVSRP